MLNLKNNKLTYCIGDWKINRKENEECLTVAGFLLFGKENIITECFPLRENTRLNGEMIGFNGKMIGLNEKNIGSNEKMIGLNKKNNGLNTVKGNKEEQYEVIEHLKLIAEPAKDKNAVEL